MTASITVSAIFYLSFTILIGFIAIPFCIYSIIRFYSFKDDKRFRVRHGKLSTFTASCFVAELFSACLLTISFSGFVSGDAVIILAWIGDILNFISYFLIIHCLVLRFWCLYYDIKYQVSMKDNVWKSLIDKHYIINKEHLSQVKSFDINDDLWFIKNKSKQGNSKWLIKVWFTRSLLSILILLGIMLTIEAIFGVGLQRGIIEVIFTILFLIPWSFMIYIYHKIPPFFDTYHIRQEIVIIHNIDLIDVIASGAISIIANWSVYTSSNNPAQFVNQTPWLNIVMIVTFYIMGISHVIIVYIMTYWVRHRIIEDEAHIMNLQRRVRNSGTHLTLTQILQHPFGYELFMQHLSNEFSIENLLSLTEFMQYKYRVQEELKIEEIGPTSPGSETEKQCTSPSSNSELLKIKLPTEDIPKSSIVYPQKGRSDTNARTSFTALALEKIGSIGSMNSDSGQSGNSGLSEEALKEHKQQLHQLYGKISYKLFEKYIKSGAEQQVNLSWETRIEFNRFMDSNNKTIYDNILLNDAEYYHLFDLCITEIIKLMSSDSYARFSHSEKYKELERHIIENA